MPACAKAVVRAGLWVSHKLRRKCAGATLTAFGSSQRSQPGAVTVS